MKRLRFAALALCLIPFVPASAQAPGPSASPKATLADVAFITGQWADASEKHLSEEVWTAPSGDSMVGMWRYVADGKMQTFAVLSIREEAGGPVLRMRHFDAEFVAREEKAAAVVLPLVEKGERYVRFEGPAVGSPGLVTMVYKRDRDELTGRMTKEGKSEEFRFRLKRWSGMSGAERSRGHRVSEGPRS